MNNLMTNIIRPAFLVTALLGALALTACGGGSDDGGALPAGKVGTVGDGVNEAEYAAIQCGMNKDQVTAIIGDAPTADLGGLIWNYKYEGGNHTQIGFTANALVNGKNTGPIGKPSTNIVNC